MVLHAKYSLLLCLYLFCSSAGAFSQNSLPPFYEIKTDTLTTQELDFRFWQILPDSSGNLMISDVTKQLYAGKFYALSKENQQAQEIEATNWLRFRLKNLMNQNAKLSLSSSAAQADFFVFSSDGKMHQYRTGLIAAWSQRDGLKKSRQIPIILLPAEEVTIYMRRSSIPADTLHHNFKIRLFGSEKAVKAELSDYEENYIERPSVYAAFFSGLFFLASIFNFLIYRQIKDKVYLFFSLFLFFISIQFHPALNNLSVLDKIGVVNFFIAIGNFWMLFFLFFVRNQFEIKINHKKWDKFLSFASIVYAVVILIWAFFFDLNGNQYFVVIRNIVTVGYLISLGITILLGLRKPGELRRVFLYSMSPFVVGLFLIIIILVLFFKDSNVELDPDILNYIIGGCIAWAVIVFSSYLFKKYGQQQKQILQEQLEKERILIEKERERNEFIAEQKIELEKQVTDRTSELKQSLHELKAAQAQLIQSEKMASLGELTAGIAHEIQNPLNFVNNFSEVSKELLGEMKDELAIGNLQLANEIASDVEQNLEKIHHHGKRADAIVKGMLQHSRSSIGQKEPTDINALADEYLRLAYHGLRAKDKNFNATIKTDFDNEIGNINIIPQDIGRVMLNLFTNAFYAVSAKASNFTEPSLDNSATVDDGYKPAVTVSTRKIDGKVEIEIADNGIGISDKIQDKIFQPFFTTKPAGQGTGLGLSLSYDIIKAHGGEIKFTTQLNKGSQFIVQLPDR